MKYPDKTVLVVMSGGLFMEMACRLARDFGKVYYYTEWRSTFPHMTVGMVGHGMEDIERVESIFGPHFDSIDLFVFPDLYWGEMQVYLERLGKRVWGARTGEEIEIYRELCKKLMEENDLPVQPWKIIKGIKALREHLQAHKEQHVKIDKWRGDFETFFSERYDLVAPKLDAIEHSLGGFKTIAEFIVEDNLPDCVEVGLDAYCIDGQYPDSTLCGIEVKDLGYVAEFKAWDDIPEPVTRWTTNMAHILESYGYRGFLSNEIRIGKDLQPYMIDACTRCGCPPNELYQEFYTNLAEIIWEGAAGNLVSPKPIAKYGVEVIMRSDWAKENHWQPVHIDPAVRQNVKLFNPVFVDGEYYVCPQGEDMAEVGAIVGYGDTLKEAHEMVKEMAKGVSGYAIKIPMGSIDDAFKQMEEINGMGINVFTLDKPKSGSDVTLQSGKKVRVNKKPKSKVRAKSL